MKLPFGKKDATRTSYDNDNVHGEGHKDLGSPATKKGRSCEPPIDETSPIRAHATTLFQSWRPSSTNISFTISYFSLVHARSVDVGCSSGSSELGGVVGRYRATSDACAQQQVIF